MIQYSRFIPVGAATLLFFAAACGQSPSSSEPKTPVAPVTVGADVTKIDLCQAIPKEDMEAVMGRKLAGAPKRFEYYDTQGTSGCWYEGKKDSSGQAYYAYVVLTPVDVYDKQPLHKKLDVSGIGERAYFNNGADTRQLWVKVNNKVAFVVANGDVENEAGQKAMAKLMVAAIK